MSERLSIREVKIQTLLDEYRKGKMSLGKAAELAGVNLWEFIEHCRVEKIDIQKYKKTIKDSLEKWKLKTL